MAEPRTPTTTPADAPGVLAAIQADTAALGFDMASEPLVGSLLRTLAAGKPEGQLLELGTGTGLGAAWLLDGMTTGARLTSIEQDQRIADVARRHLGDDARATFVVGDAGVFLEEASGSFDLIFADTWAGKFTHLDEALALLAPGGIYVVDDLLPQPNWPDGHGGRVAALVARLEADPGLAVSRLDWATGVLVAARRPVGEAGS